MSDQGSKQSNKSMFAEIEEKMLATWEQEGTFEQSMKQREGQEYFSFFDGPPFANGLPHFGHSLVTGIKDSMLRYKTMRGYYVPRRNGWDCHGLPVEYAIEKQFEVSGKKQIEELGIDKFNAACRDSIFTYKDTWETFLKRIGRWSEYDNYYATVNTEYTESVWWVMQQVHQKGLLYKGYKSMPYCPRCETPLSNFEVNEGYQDDVSDPSLYVKFKLKGEDVSLLAWTTTPWSLPGNAAVAVNPTAQYVYVYLKDESAQTGETLIVAKERLAIFDDIATYTIEKEVQGSELVGLEYEPLFNVDFDKLCKDEPVENLYKVWPAEFVSIEDGTGVLHVAPAFGEDDLKLGQENSIPVLSTIGHDGKVKVGIGLDASFEGKFFKGADKFIIELLTQKGCVYLAQTFKHTYPFCYRCDTPLLYYAISTWFIKVTDIKSDLLKTADEINWTPNHIKTGRFGKWLEGARDWAISRNRYWGAPMPVWVNIEDETDYIVVGSIAELKELAGDDIKVDDLHRPFIDDITFEKDGKTYKRIEEVIDCWFESGSMSVAQQHYPFENKDTFDKTFPADFIIEGLDQTRLWFYVQHVIATILFDRPAYKNVVVNGIINAADGQKLSKRLKNYPATDDVFDQEGADSWRLYLLASSQATESADYMRFDRQGMKDMQRNVIGTLWNSYSFFNTYAMLDKWQPQNTADQPAVDNELDKWILARLNQAIAESTESADNYKIAHAIEPVMKLIEDMSNWYIRRSRRRFWKSENDGDKEQAYQTLWFVLTRTCQLLAPWAPFMSDHMYRELTAGLDMPQSVHLSDWPVAQDYSQATLEAMQQLRLVITEGLSKRAESGIKVRQPLAHAVLCGPSELSEGLLAIAKDELNVHEVSYKKADEVSAELDTTITEDLKLEGIMRDFVRLVQSSRKKADFNVEDRIQLGYKTESADLQAAIATHMDTIKSETLAVEVSENAQLETEFTEKVAGEQVTLWLERVRA